MDNKTVLRVGVYNNFNFTDLELAEVGKYTDTYLPFVNSNSFVTIRGEFPSIVTINPYLNSWQEPVGDLTNLKACRVKWVEGAVADVYKAQVEAIKWCVDRSIPVLITFMRFASRRTLLSFVTESSEHLYQYSRSYYRLPYDQRLQALSHIREFSDNPDELIYTCDIAGKGCPDCGNCSKLTYGVSEGGVSSLSLSCSGDAGECIFHCPDCWAKRLGRITNFKYDAVTINNKQKGE